MGRPSKLESVIRRKCKRMREIKMRRLQKKKQGRKPSEIKRTAFEKIVDKFVTTLFRRRLIATQCAHYLIGGSMGLAFLRGKYSVKRAHAFLDTPSDNKITGQAGEEAFLRSNLNICIKHPFGIHKNMPWICATGDFITNEFGRKCLIEIKTFTEYERAVLFYNNPDQRSIMQLWTQMEVFCINFGKLMVYFLDRVSKIVCLIGSISFERKATLFTRQLISLSTIRYVEFLKEYFERQGVYPSDEYYNMLSSRIANNVLCSSDVDISNEYNAYINTIKRKIYDVCDYHDGASVCNTSDTRAQFEPYSKMFACHKFINRSKLSSIIVLDEEYRREFTEEIFRKITAEKKVHSELIQSKANACLTIDNLISKSRIAKAQRWNKVKKNRLNEKINCNEKKLIFMIQKQKLQLKSLRKEVKSLKSKLSRSQLTPLIQSLHNDNKLSCANDYNEDSVKTTRRIATSLGKRCNESTKTIKLKTKS